MTNEIISKSNSIYKDIKKLITSNDKGYFFIEGITLLYEALSSNLPLRRIILDESNPEIQNIKLKSPKDCEIIYMNEDLVASLYTTDTKPSGDKLVFAVAEPCKWDINDIFGNRKNILCLIDLQDPGNLGTIFRTALAFNAGGIVLLKGSVSPLNTKVVRSSAGAVFKVPYFTFNSISDLAPVVKKYGYKLISTSTSGKLITEMTSLWTSPNVLIFGNEGRGLDSKILQITDEVISVPHTKNVESLNVAVAASVILWDAYIKGI